MAGVGSQSLGCWVLRFLPRRIRHFGELAVATSEHTAAARHATPPQAAKATATSGYAAACSLDVRRRSGKATAAASQVVMATQQQPQVVMATSAAPTLHPSMKAFIDGSAEYSSPEWRRTRIFAVLHLVMELIYAILAVLTTGFGIIWPLLVVIGHANVTCMCCCKEDNAKCAGTTIIVLNSLAFIGSIVDFVLYSWMTGPDTLSLTPSEPQTLNP